MVGKFASCVLGQVTSEIASTFEWLDCYKQHVAAWLEDHKSHLMLTLCRGNLVN